MSQNLVDFLNTHTEVLNTNDVEKSGKQPQDIEFGRNTVRLNFKDIDENQLKNDFAKAIIGSNAKKILDGKSHSRDEVKSWLTYGKDMDIKFMALATALGFTEITDPYKNADIGTRYAFSHHMTIKAVLKQEIPVPKVTGEGKEQQETVSQTPAKGADIAL